jgi:hypothetical protein
MCKNLEEARMWKHRFEQEWDEPNTKIHYCANGTYMISAYEPEVCGFERHTPHQLMTTLNDQFEKATKPKPEPKEPRKPSRFEDIIR